MDAQGQLCPECQVERQLSQAREAVLEAAKALHRSGRRMPYPVTAEALLEFGNADQALMEAVAKLQALEAQHEVSEESP